MMVRMVATSDTCVYTIECLSRKGIAQKWTGHEPQPAGARLHARSMALTAGKVKYFEEVDAKLLEA